MKTIKLEFRAKMPDGKYFNQGTQYLTSYLRRVLLLCNVTHPKYLNGELEDILEIKINGKWIPCNFK